MTNQRMRWIADIYAGWDGYQTSLVKAIAPLTRDQLVWRPDESLNSVGELARHISMGRIEWFVRMKAPGSKELADQIQFWEKDRDGNQHIIESALQIADQPPELVRWLESTWGMIAATLHAWQISDLAETYRYTWSGEVYANSRQWTIWRILTHDIHHGGQISLMLGMQGIEAFELGSLFGHITMPPFADVT